MERAWSERVLRNMSQPGPSGQDDGRLLESAPRPRWPRGCATWRSAPTRAARSDCPPPRASRRAQVGVGTHSDRGRLSTRSAPRYGRADGQERRGRRPHVVGAGQRPLRSRGSKGSPWDSSGHRPTWPTAVRSRGATRPRAGWPISSGWAPASSRRSIQGHRQSVAAVRSRGAAVARGDVPEPSRRVRRR